MPRCSRPARHLERTVADQAGTEQRRRLGVRMVALERKAVLRVRHRVIGIAAIDVVAGEPGRIAQVLSLHAAIAAAPAGMSEPGHADPVSGRERRHLRPDRNDLADDLVTGHDRQTGLGEVTVDDVQVGSAHAAGRYPDQHLPLIRHRHVALLQTEGRAGPVKNHRLHGPHHSLLGAQATHPAARHLDLDQAIAALGMSNPAVSVIVPETRIVRRLPREERGRCER